MKYPLLKMVQLILSGMDSDEVQDINDTTESRQIVDVIEMTYYDLASQMDFPDYWDLFELEASLDISRPTLMYLPSNVTKLEWVQYDFSEDGATARNFKPIIPMSRERFFDRMNTLDTDQPDVYQYNLEVGTGTFDVRGKNNAFPTYFTTTDDRSMVFDNYRADINQTLVGNKTKCYGMRVPEFVRDNDFVPDFPLRQFTLLFNEAKSQAFLDLKQVQNAKADQRARRALTQAGRKEPAVPGGNIRDWKPNYGRHR